MGYIKDMFSNRDNVSSTRAVLFLTMFFVFAVGGFVIYYDKFTSEIGWFLLSLFVAAIGGKSVKDFKSS